MKNKRRRRIPYRKYTARPKQDGSFSFFVAVAILLALAYLGAATKAGTFLAEKVVRPVFEQLGVFAGDRAAPEASSSPEGTVSYTAPAMDFYFLQVGVYASQENAETEAKSIQSQGGAGYVYQDKEDFRVILSAYTSQDDKSASYTYRGEKHTDNNTGTKSGPAARDRAIAGGQG